MAFDLKAFTLELIAESVFYDDEYGLFSNVILIDKANNREAYYAYYDPEKDDFVIEVANAWEALAEEEYQIASAGEEHSRYESVEELSAKLLDMAEAGELEPKVMIIFEDDEEG
ncbi:MAG: hypothetical protein JNN12_06040 [Bacteroidetes Order II. Incertae sedis bacterium]|nr:hypothetical protein [Bacteroidetes Order II. bacterium]